MKDAVYIEDCTKIPKRAREALVAAGARTLEDILRFSAVDVLNMHGINWATMKKVAQVMKSYGYSWPSSWPL